LQYQTHRRVNGGVPCLSSCVLRGFNYWDITEARVVFTPAVPGQGSESASVVSLVDANEPTDGAQACPRPNTQQCDLQSCSFSGACQRENHDASMLLPGRFHTTTFVRSRCLRWSISTASARLPRSRSSVVLLGHEPRPVCCGASQRAPHKRFQPRGALSFGGSGGCATTGRLVACGRLSTSRRHVKSWFGATPFGGYS
jgi:hypothetical protein